jgi:uncharacterized membrane protein YraQ (UPF0718 family)
MVIAVFLGWQFVVGEYVGGVLLILISWLIISVLKPQKLIQQVRENLGQSKDGSQETKPFIEKVKSSESWIKIGKQYLMEWKMVWKDVTLGFTIAGVIAAFVPDSFFQTLFINSGTGQTDYSFWELLQHVVIGPVAAFTTFIGSMGNIPLAALLFGKGVSFAGVMAFIFSDLVVFPVLRINAKYYGWKMSLFILFLLFASLILTSLILHYSLDFMNLIPEIPEKRIKERKSFEIDYTFFLNIFLFIISGLFFYLARIKGKDVHYHKEMAMKSPVFEKTLKYIAWLCYAWLAVGLCLKVFI